MCEKTLAKSDNSTNLNTLAALEPKSGELPNGTEPKGSQTPKHEPKTVLRKRASIEEVKANIAALPKAKFDVADVACLYRETMLRFENYQRRVNEGLDLEAAHEFCSFVFNSGLEKLFS